MYLVNSREMKQCDNNTITYYKVPSMDFVAGINTATYMHYIDFASRNGIEYVILDDG